MAFRNVMIDRNIKGVFTGCFIACLMAFVVGEWLAFVYANRFSIGLFWLFVGLTGALFAILYRFFARQSHLLDTASTQVRRFIDGETDARIECNEEGAVYRLFYSVNALAATLYAQKEREMQEKVFLKETISDVSHQLKTPLAALNIYNGLLYDETEVENIREFARLSELELERLETLVQNLLKLTKLNAGTVVMEKQEENVEEMMNQVIRHFEYRATQENKTIQLSGDSNVTLSCNRDWLLEAMDNLVKNGLDHTASGDFVKVEWRAQSSLVQIRVFDNGSGIHPEDLPYIFKRFYRSRFSKDYQGIGLGLSLAKAIIETNHGVIEVDSELGKGSCFTINFLIPTKL